MTQETEDVVARLSRKQDGYPQTGRGTIDSMGRGTVEMDPAPQVYVNPDGHAAIKLIEKLSDRIDVLARERDHWKNECKALCDVVSEHTKARAALHQEGIDG